jgi:hypothetical protein
MIDSTGFTVWTFRSDDGATEQVWNPTPGVEVPDFIQLGLFPDVTAAIDPGSGVFEGPGYDPGTMRVVEPWVAPPMVSGQTAQVAVGWPGQVQVSDV